MNSIIPLAMLCGLAAQAPAPADDAPPPTTRPRVLVLDPSSHVFDPATVQTITGLLIVELSADPRLDIISATDVKKLAELESDKQAVGCVDSSCLAELAGAMGARYVIFGDVGKLGDTVVMTLNLFDSSTTLAVQRITVQAEGIGGLPSALKGKLTPLVQPLLASTTAPDATPPSADGTAANSASAAAESGPGIGPWLLIGGGAAVTVVGAAIDIFSPTSRNGVPDAGDAVGPVSYLLGPTLAVVGAVWMWGASSDEEESP